MKVIVVDDNKVELREISRLVENSGLNLEIVGRFVNGQEAYEFILENEVDIVVSDVQMPVMDGIELIQKINQCGKKVGVILVSCYDDFNYMKGALKNNAFDYILKPIDKNEFMVILAALCEKCANEKNIVHSREEAELKLKKYEKIVTEETIRQLFLGTCEIKNNISVILAGIQNSVGVMVAKCRIVELVNVGEEQNLEKQNAWFVSFLKNQLEDLENENLQIYVAIMSMTEVVAVFAEKNTMHDLEKMLILFKQKMFHELGVVLSIGISNKNQSWESLMDLYQQAETALGYTYGTIKGITVRYEEIVGESREDIGPNQILNDVQKILIEGDKEAIEPFLTR